VHFVAPRVYFPLSSSPEVGVAITNSYRSRPVGAAHEFGTGALVIHCSDPRYVPHFQDFLRNGLGLEHYALVAVPGAVHALTLTEYLPKFAWVGWRWVSFLEKLVQPARVVLIGHHDCRWYSDARFLHHHGGGDAAQHADLRRVRTELQARFPDAAVETWYARLDGLQATFDAE
jgi:hypothetical protein